MRNRALVGALALAIAAAPATLRAQDAAADAPDAVVTAETAAAAAEDEGLLGDDELDTLVAPVALYPDSLLTQVLVASTYPLDIIKADRFLAAEPDLSPKDRAARAETEDWDPSVQVLAGGFPSVVTTMATDIDWTEQLGDAILAQPDDVLDAVQRQRARAAAVGNLATNDAQVVEETGDSISIVPAEPDVVYVPQYDATTAYTTPYTQPAVIDSGGPNLLATGAIAFGSALLVDEIFDDDDDWDDYWHGPAHIDWDEGDLRPNRDIDINGDVTIDRDRTNVIAGSNRDEVRNRVAERTGDRPGTWKPSPEQQAQARERLAERKAKGGGVDAAKVRDKAAARGDGKGASRQEIGAKLGERKDLPAKPRDSALTPKKIDAKKTKAALDRGDLSKNKAKAAKAAKKHPQAVSRAKAAHKPPKKAPAKASAFKQHGGGGHAKAAKARGAHSRDGGHRRR
ncbi:DUF3300 domain-containing protein [Amaricoccus sp.]|uniref:DUF3300 domain-containing protein n=1 Tax=Amaricoccus sp. TaxID=1872485 RepID=UPI002628D22F|nr:DUF3300 domain-containing protein [Amaricoccus sp.]HRO10758.1 DUF3300 domain-containing protein [Amaricoccus sp.]